MCMQGLILSSRIGLYRRQSSTTRVLKLLYFYGMGSNPKSLVKLKETRVASPKTLVVPLFTYFMTMDFHKLNILAWNICGAAVQPLTTNKQLLLVPYSFDLTTVMKTRVPRDRIKGVNGLIWAIALRAVIIVRELSK